MKELAQKIKEIAKKNPQGFTIYIPSLERVTKGWVIANSATQDCFNDEGLKNRIQELYDSLNIRYLKTYISIFLYLYSLTLFLTIIIL